MHKTLFYWKTKQLFNKESRLIEAIIIISMVNLSFLNGMLVPYIISYLILVVVFNDKVLLIKKHRV